MAFVRCFHTQQRLLFFKHFPATGSTNIVSSSLTKNLSKKKSTNTSSIVTCIHHHHAHPITELQLNRPDKLNALNAEMVELLLKGIDEAKNRRSQLLVIRGSGRVFSAGFDLSGLKKETDASLLYRFVRIETLLQAIYTAPMPTLGLVHGSCVGAGADIIASCTHRVAAPNTLFRMPGLQFGVVLGTRRLAALVGPDTAIKILQTAHTFDSTYALSCRFLTEIANTDDWPTIIKNSSAHAGVLNVETRFDLMRNIRGTSELGNDMAELVRSASRPGLTNRINNYVKSPN